jgi:hypothetical protein
MSGAAGRETSANKGRDERVVVVTGSRDRRVVGKNTKRFGPKDRAETTH